MSYIMMHNAAVEQCPKGICLELLVLPAAERRGNQEFAAQLPRSPRSEAEGGTSYSKVSGYLRSRPECAKRRAISIQLSSALMACRLPLSLYKYGKLLIKLLTEIMQPFFLLPDIMSKLRL